MSKVYIILLNWNNWPDTLECLESLLHLDYLDFRIVVCDNGSTDVSLERLQGWAAGKLDILPRNRNLLPGCKPYPKPVHINILDGPCGKGAIGLRDDALITILRNCQNLGFAGGYNLGLRYALARCDADYCWILNNDTVVDPHALTALVERMQSKPGAGVCGSTILKYNHPEIVDALGGACYLKWLGLAWHIGRERRLPDSILPEKIEKHMDYVVGSSMLVSRSFLQKVGLMDESYFLYYEELDWAMQCQGRFSLAYAPDSRVYHKIGASIGTSSHPARKSLVSDFYTLRNRLKFTRKYCPVALPTVYLGVLTAMIVRLAFGQWRKALMTYRLLLNPRRSFEQCTATS